MQGEVAPAVSVVFARTGVYPHVEIERWISRCHRPADGRMHAV